MASSSLVLQVVFWACAGLVVYSYLGYPLVIWLAARLCGRTSSPAGPTDELPTVSLLIAAHNEERFIEEKLHNALATDYPRDRLEILVASDGSSDETAAIVRRFSGEGVRLLDYKQRRGKSAVLNASVPEARGDVVVFSDANTFYEPAAIRRLVRRFSDPGVGIVCGRLVLTDPETGRNVDSLYWRYETFLKKCEARLGGLLGANGAIYAMRRSQYTPMPDNTIVDDFVIPLLAKLRHRCRIVYEAGAVAFEESPPTIRSEFRRRSRIGTGGYQSISLLWKLLDPRHGWTAFSFLSHKVLRWSVPFLLVAMLAANLLLLDLPGYRWLLAAHLCFYGLSALGLLIGGNGLPSRLLRLAAMFSSMNAALMVGFWRWLVWRQQGTWQRTVRS